MLRVRWSWYFRARVFIKRKCKMTGDCSVFRVEPRFSNFRFRFDARSTFLSSISLSPNLLSFPFPFQRVLRKQSTRNWPQNSRFWSTLASTRTSSICWEPALGESDWWWSWNLPLMGACCLFCDQRGTFTNPIGPRQPMIRRKSSH